MTTSLTQGEEHQIEIPFPQRDLHLRSVDEKVIAALKK
jgi:small-conductance mechanosensitive channel